MDTLALGVLIMVPGSTMGAGSMRGTRSGLLARGKSCST